MTNFGSLEVKFVEEHEDGSATYTIEASQEALTKLFSAFFQEAVLRGITETEKQNKEWVKTHPVGAAAKELHDLLLEWETSDELDYHPKVREARLKLTEALTNANG